MKFPLLTTFNLYSFEVLIIDVLICKLKETY